MDPERALHKSLALENSSASSNSEQISLPNAGALERELHSSDDEGPEIQVSLSSLLSKGRPSVKLELRITTTNILLTKWTRLLRR